MCTEGVGTRRGHGVGGAFKAEIRTRSELRDKGRDARTLNEEYDHFPNWEMEDDSPGLNQPGTTVRVFKERVGSYRGGSHRMRENVYFVCMHGHHFAHHEDYSSFILHNLVPSCRGAVTMVYNKIIEKYY